MKKVLLVLTFIFFANIFLTGCSYGNLNNRVTSYGADDVAVLSIFTFDGKGESKYGIANLGHSFLSVTNTSSSNINLAGKDILPNEELYFGTWSLSAHFGVWFNVESNYIEYYNKYNGRISISKGITLNDLEILSNHILKNDTWNPLSNCSCFAINAWNSVANETEKLQLNLINTPSNLKKQLLQFTNYETNKPIVNYSTCGYFADLTEDAFVFEGGEVYV